MGWYPRGMGLSLWVSVLVALECPCGIVSSGMGVSLWDGIPVAREGPFGMGS